MLLVFEVVFVMMVRRGMGSEMRERVLKELALTMTLQKVRLLRTSSFSFVEKLRPNKKCVYFLMARQHELHQE